MRNSPAVIISFPNEQAAEAAAAAAAATTLAEMSLAQWAHGLPLSKGAGNPDGQEGA